jgi:diaminohydroxyphosphoribosylaminopyrimidine deaminase/5-amino-6-(5-phosphoribosylamino)uracil reductase
LLLPTHDPAEVLRQLDDLQIGHLWLEGGPTLAAAFLREGLVDEAVVHLAPMLLGSGPSLVGDLGLTSIGEALSLQTVDVLPMGGDLQIRLRPTRHTGGRQVVREGS